MTLPDEQRKQIEREAEKEYPYMGGLTGAAMNESCRTARIGYKKVAEKYTLLCHQKDEQIKRLRQGLENVRRCCSSCGDDPVFRDSVIKDIDSIAEETLEINKL